MLTKLKLAMLISAPLVAGATTYAVAQGDGPKQELLQKFDKNGDGKLDDAERATMRDAKLTERFKTMDANGDGKLTLDEFKAAAAKQGAFHHHGRHGHGHMRSKAAAGTK